MSRTNNQASPVNVLSAEFVAETRSVASLPPVGAPEIAIAGRSNVGKSTLLNRLAGRRSLARTSKTPGRTRGIIFYDLTVTFAPPAADPAADSLPAMARQMRLVDLPGYGYARVSQSERLSWQTLIESYVTGRKTVALFVVLVDGRRGIEDEERQLVEWLVSVSVPFQLVYTKVDKLSASERGLLRRAPPGIAVPAASASAPAGDVRTASTGAAMRRPLLVSGETGEGVADLWRVIAATTSQTLPPGSPAA